MELTHGTEDSIAIGGEVSGGTTGSVLFVGPAATLAQDNPNFFWNDTDNRLNVGTNAGTARLTVKGAGTTTGTTFRLTDSADRSLFEVNDAGFVGMSTAPSALWKLDFVGQYFQMGSDSTSNNLRTNDTVKLFGIVTPHYSNAANAVWGIGVQSTSVANTVFIGGGVTAGANAATAISFSTNSTTTGGVGTVRMALSNTILRIGSGDATTTPAAVQLLGPRAAGGADIAGTHWTTVSGLATGSAVSGDFIFQTGDPLASGSTIQTPTTRLIVKGGTGRVGIGTTNPQQLFHLNSASSSTRFRVQSTGGSVDFLTGSQGEFRIDTDSVVGAMTVRQDGRVGITDTTPDYKLEIQTSIGSGYLGITNSSDGDVFVVDSSGNVGVGVAAPNANAILDVSSTTKAFMPPRMTTTQKNAIASPTAGMVVFDSDLMKLCVYTTTWETITSA